LDQLKTGDQVAIASDVTNLARSLGILARFGVITLKDGIDPTKVSLSDIASNPKNLKFQTLDGAQISGAWTAWPSASCRATTPSRPGLDFTKALAIEKLAEGYKNVVAVRTPDVDSQLGRDLKAAVESEDFYKRHHQTGHKLSFIVRPAAVVG
jgi:D-methionine transport system substrate-binding protein